MVYVDRFLRSENYDDKWVYNVIHSTHELNEQAIVKALGLVEAKGSSPNLKYYQLTKDNLLLEELARLAVTGEVPRFHRPRISPENPLFVRFHDDQTLIVADQIPMQEYLKYKGRFPVQSQITTSNSNGNSNLPIPQSSGQNETNKDGSGKSPKELQGGIRFSSDSQPPTEMYMTINPRLKKVLDKLEKIPQRRSARILFSSATLLTQSARRPIANPLRQNDLLWKMRQTWDVTSLLDDAKPQVQVLGVAVVQKDFKHLAFRNALVCAEKEQAEEVTEELLEEAAPTMIQFINQAYAHKVILVREEEEPKPVNPNYPFPMGSNPDVVDPSGNPIPPQKPSEEEPKKSRILVTLDEEQVFFTLDLIWDDPQDDDRFRSSAALILFGLKTKIDMAESSGYKKLAQAIKLLGEKGFSEAHIPPGHFPPATIRQGGETLFPHEPLEKLSWMVALLPKLGHRTLYDNIALYASWKDERNWLAAQTMVPEFLSPVYPDVSRVVSYPGLPLDVAATHFVGIAGVGVDAANYPHDPDDPAYIGKLGVFGYNRSTSLEDIKKSRGKLSNTAVVIQVPPNSPAGLTPWIAGGGSTVRGIPEKDSVKPFVAKHGAIGNGTFAIMADGTVRFVKESIPDNIFQALCTYNGPAPEEFEASLNKFAPVVNPDKLSKIPVPEPIKPDPVGKKPTPPEPKTPKKTADWETYTSKKEDFSILLPPGKPEVKREEIPKENGGGYFLEVVQSYQDKFGFGVMVQGLPEPIDPLTVASAKYIENVKKTYLGAFNPKAESKILLDDKYPGRELVFTGPTGTAVLRVFVTESRIFMIRAGGLGFDPESEESKAFFKSFRYGIK